MTADPPPLDPSGLDAKRILVVAPHPDDESLGCGGLVSILADFGRRFHVVFVTDGGASHRGSKAWPRQRLAALRAEEAAEALCRLGIGGEPRTFLGLADAAMPPLASEAGRAALASVAAVLNEFAPDLVLLPWRRDPHCDHRDSWQLAHAAMNQAAMKPATFEYAIWLDELGAAEDRPRPGEAERIAFDIGKDLAKKRAAIAAHRSQTTDLIDDDPEAFRLAPATIERLAGPLETYWRPLR